MNKIIAIMLVLVLAASYLIAAKPAFSSAEAAEYSWAPKAPMQTPRDRLGAAAVNGKIYAIGGDYVDLIGNCIGPGFGNPVNTTEEYNPAADTWVFKKPMPTSRCSFAVAVYEGKIYCIGGYRSDRTFTGINEVYDPATDTWETKTPMPTSRMDLQANVVDGKIYLIGGRTDGLSYLSVNEVYDPKTDSWTTAAPSPNRITSGASAAADGKIYVLATVSNLDLGAFVQVYNPESDAWNVGALSPTYGEWSTTAASTGSGADAKLVFFSESSTYIYNPAGDNWTSDAQMPTARGFTGVAVLNGLFYVIGGIKAPFAGYIVITSSVATNEQYTPNNGQPVNVDNKIHIKADGSIEPSTANITTTDKIHYTFTGDDFRRLVIEKDNVVLDGNGHWLQGSGSYGIALFNRTNVVIKNLTIAQFEGAGIAMERSTNIIITQNNIFKSLNNGIRTFASSNNTIVGNRIENNELGSGIQFEDSSNNNLVYGNDIIDNYCGILLIGSKDNQIYHNNLQNSVNAKTSDKLGNVWDNGYPSGGNWWSDYNGADQNKDGIGDTLIVFINENNNDNYPLMARFNISSVTTEMPDWEYAMISPLISIVSPEDQEYNETAVPLIFTVNKPTVWLGYSLDGQENVTVTGNTTLTGLSAGLHNVNVYARDEFNNTGASEPISFTVAEEPFPVAPVAAASVATVAVVGAVLLVYFKKRKH
jgi:parallel beta-helix repeat protein